MDTFFVERNGPWYDAYLVFSWEQELAICSTAQEDHEYWTDGRDLEARDSLSTIMNASEDWGYRD